MSVNGLGLVSCSSAIAVCVCVCVWCPRPQALELLQLSSGEKQSTAPVLSALLSLHGARSVFARSAGHAFLCEAMSRKDTTALPMLLDELLDIKLHSL